MLDVFLSTRELKLYLNITNKTTGETLQYLVSEPLSELFRRTIQLIILTTLESELGQRPSRIN